MFPLSLNPQCNQLTIHNDYVKWTTTSIDLKNDECKSTLVSALLAETKRIKTQGCQYFRTVSANNVIKE